MSSLPDSGESPPVTIAPAKTLVSVVTVCFNSERHIGEAIESVLAQDYLHIEYLIVDGGSTDRTIEIVASYTERFEGRLRWVSEPDNGIYDAMNKGIAMCSGELIGLLNSDDRYAVDAISTIVQAAQTHPDAGLVYGDVRVIDEDGSVLATEIAKDVHPGDRPDWLPMCHQSLFVKRDVYRTVGVYDIGYRILADYEFVLRCLAAGVSSLHVPSAIAEFRVGGLCNTGTLEANREREQIRVAYGASPLVERVRYLRHRLNMWLYARLGRHTRREP